MTRRSRTILTVSIQFPIPVGKSQQWVLEELKRILVSAGVGTKASLDLVMTEAVIKLEKKEIIYL